MNDGVSKLGREQLLRQKFDDKYSEKSEYLDILEAVYKLESDGNAKLKEVQARLKKWDRRTNVDNQYAALAVKLLSRIVLSDTPEDHSPQRLLKEIDWTVAYLTRHFGGVDVTWGEVNRIVRGDKNLPIDGGPDILRAVYAMGLKDDEKPYATVGDSWMALVAWDETGEQSAELIHQFGSASADKTSPHYNDQVEMFVAQKWRTAEFDFNKLKANAKRVYTPQSLGDSQLTINN